jgi:hypothetical protein
MSDKRKVIIKDGKAYLEVQLCLGKINTTSGTPIITLQGAKDLSECTICNIINQKKTPTHRKFELLREPFESYFWCDFLQKQGMVEYGLSYNEDATIEGFSPEIEVEVVHE